MHIRSCTYPLPDHGRSAEAGPELHDVLVEQRAVDVGVYRVEWKRSHTSNTNLPIRIRAYKQQQTHVGAILLVGMAILWFARKVPNKYNGVFFACEP